MFLDADWVAGLATSMSVFNRSIPVSKFKNYIQHIEKDERLEIKIFENTNQSV